MRHKTVHLVLAVLMLFFLTVPTAFASPNQTTTVAATTESTSTQTSPDATVTASAPVPQPAKTPSLDDALADAETAVRQTQADRIRQELDNLGDELERLNTEYFAESAKLAAIEESLNETRDQLRWYEAELEAQNQVLNDRLENIYKHGDMEPVEAIINNTSFSELYTRLSMLLRIGEQDAQLLENLRDKKLKIEETKNALDQLFTQQQQVTTDLESRRKVIEDKMKEETTVLAGLDDETKKILEQEEEQRRQEQAEVVKKLTQAPQPDGRIALEPGTIAFEAIKYLGIPYVWGGEDPQYGLDCSGLVKVVYKKFGVELYHYTGEQVKAGIPVEYGDLQAGDLVFFGHPIHHVGIYIGEGYYIHAPKRNDVVKISKLADRRDYNCARRILSILPTTDQQPMP